MKIKPAIQDLEVQRGDDWSFTFDIDVDGTILNITGMTILAQVRTEIDTSSTLIIDFDVSTNLSTNEITLSLDSATSTAITHSQGYYDVLVINGTDKTHYVKGSVVFTGTVTEEAVVTP